MAEIEEERLGQGADENLGELEKLGDTIEDEWLNSSERLYDEIYQKNKLVRLAERVGVTAEELEDYLEERGLLEDLHEFMLLQRLERLKDEVSMLREEVDLLKDETGATDRHVGKWW